MTHSSPLIALRDISKSFGSHVAIKGIDLTIGNGEFLTLLGSSGCGKTTILRILSGFESPDTGSVFIDSKDCTATPPERRQVNTVFQNYALFPHMSLFDNVAFGLRMQGLGKAEIEQRVMEAWLMVHLGELAGRQPGERMRRG